MQEPIVLTPTDFIAITNQILETSFGFLYLKGEVSDFRISKQKWVYFDLKDDYSKVSCFGSVYSLPGPIEDGMLVKIGGSPRMHPQFGFSITYQSITPEGEGSLNKAFALLKQKLTKEGFFDIERKRTLPALPSKIALVASVESAAYADFIKIITARWPFLEIKVYDTLVQGEQAPQSLARAISAANKEAELADVLIVTRGGGSADDLAAFNDERVIREIAASRVPTLVAIGHEMDELLAELVADKRASTPSNAAEILVPDKSSECQHLLVYKKHLSKSAISVIAVELQTTKLYRQHLRSSLNNALVNELNSINKISQLLNSYNPHNVLKRGYAVVKSGDRLIKNVQQAAEYSNFDINFADGSINVTRGYK